MEYGKRNELKNVYTYGNERISAETIVDVGEDASGSLDSGAAGSPSDAPGSASNGASGNPLDSAPGNLGGGASGILPNPEDQLPSAGDDDYTTDYYLYDGRGSVSQVVNGNEIVESYNYDPFGNVTSGAPDFDSFYGYNAEETNPVTGLQYLRARYYDTEDGRFSVADTYLGDVSKPLTLNRYAYTANNPVMNIDPSGHIFGWVKNAVSKAVDVVKSVGSAIGNGIKAAYNHLVDAAQERADNKKGQNGNYSYSSKSSSGSSYTGSSGSGGRSTTSSKNQYGNSNRSNAQSYTKQQMEIIKERYVKPFCDGSVDKIDKQNQPLREVKDLRDYKRYKIPEGAIDALDSTLYAGIMEGLMPNLDTLVAAGKLSLELATLLGTLCTGTDEQKIEAGKELSAMIVDMVEGLEYILDYSGDLMNDYVLSVMDMAKEHGGDYAAGYLIGNGIELLIEFYLGYKGAKAAGNALKGADVVEDTKNVSHAVGNANQAQSVLDGIDPKYFNSDSRFGGGFYVGDNAETIVAELAEHGNTANYAIKYDLDLSKQKVLDLTDSKIAAQWGYNPRETPTSVCQDIGKVAREQGYNVIAFDSYRGEGVNYVIYDNFDETLIPRMVTPID